MAVSNSVTIESWILLALVLFVFTCRIISRSLRLGAIKKFQIDDYLMAVVVACFIIVIVAIYVNEQWGNNFVTAAQVASWTEEDYHHAVLGSKWLVAMEVCKVSTVWGCKTCLLILYYRMTTGLPHYRRWVTIVAAYVALGYFVVIICYLAVWCRPFRMYWDTIPLPPDKRECTTYKHHMITDAVFNISSDLAMLCLPIPMLLKAQIPLKRKVVLIAIFSLGLLVILCAALNRIYSFVSPYGSTIYLNWYAGETSTAVIVANLPHLWPLISRVFHVGTFKPSSGGEAFYPPGFVACAGAAASRGRDIDKHGYVRHESEGRIADGRMQWQDRKSFSSAEDMELRKYLTPETGMET